MINAKHYKNCINKSLITGEPDAKLVDLFAIPELHIMEGTVNTIVENIEKNWSLEKMQTLYTSLHITKSGQHASKFNGNPCQKILKNWSIFYDALPLEKA